jgi:hypothetical protein
MKQYMENIQSTIGLNALGDLDYVSNHEIYNYTPGFREVTAGWRETGHILRSKF